MATFDECIDFSLKNSGLCLPEGFKLKEKQVQTLKSVFAKTDCMSILPTGYGESIIFQRLPWFLQRKYHRTSPMIVIVVSPLSSLMQDQVMALRRQGIKARCVNIGGKYSPIYSVSIFTMYLVEQVVQVPCNSSPNE